nr:SDR family oxidoreductase [Actinomadura rayongensis]
MIEKDGGTAVALPLDVGRSDTFPAFKDAVVQARQHDQQLGARDRTGTRLLRLRVDERRPGRPDPLSRQGTRHTWHPRQLRRPGATRTRIADDAFAKYPEVIPPLAARTVLGRLGEPDDIGAVIAFLLADGGWITAQDIEVSGGYNL